MEKSTEVNLSGLESSIKDFKFAGGKIGDIISALFEYLIVGAGLLLLLYLVFGGIQLMTSKGDPKAMEAAKGKIGSALIGFVVVFVSFWLVQILGSVLKIPAVSDIFR